MKMAVSSYLFYSRPTSFLLPSLLLLYLLFHERHWLTITSGFQSKKTNNNETFLAMQNTRATTQ